MIGSFKNKGIEDILLFDNSPDFWLRMQTCWDLYWAIAREQEEIKKIEIETLVTPKIELK